MKFIVLREDTTYNTVTADEIHLYGNPKDGYYYFDGTKLVQIPIKQASKIIRDAEDSKREDSKESEAARKKRLLKIKGDLKDPSKMLDKIKWEAEKKKYDADDLEGDKPEVTRSVKDTKLDMLKNDIEDFIASQVGIDLRWDYGKPSPFTIDRDIMLKTRRHKHSKKIPSVSVYFDRSGSWGDKRKTSLGWDAISVLHDYEQANLIDVTVYYFAVNVHKEEAKALAECNNSGEPIIQHMIATNSDNIIIMTDDHVIYPDDWTWNGEATYPTSVCHVPGAAIGIFYDTRESAAKETMKHIQGDLGTKYYVFY